MCAYLSTCTNNARKEKNGCYNLHEAFVLLLLLYVCAVATILRLNYEIVLFSSCVKIFHCCFFSARR